MRFWGFAGFFFIALRGSAFAAPCCGGGSSLPSLITNDDKAQVGIAASYAYVVGNAPDSGRAVFRSDRNQESTTQLSLEGATLLTDMWQAGVQIPVLFRRHDEFGRRSETINLGDIQLSTAYEVLPELSYSAWRPRGWVYTGLTLPTGASDLDVAIPGGTEETGKGVFTVAFGTVMSKQWGVWDASVTPEFRYTLPRSGTLLSGVSVQTEGGMGAGLSLAGGVSPIGDLRVGLVISPQWTQKRDSTVDGLEVSGGNQVVWTSGVSVSYVWADRFAAIVSYMDDTLTGPAKNSNLNRTLLLRLQTRWPR